MRVVAVPMDKGACGYFRITEPARAAKLAGLDITVVPEIEIDGDRDKDGALTVYEILHDCDVLILQRPAMQAYLAVAEQAQKQGISVVVEMDDDIQAVHKQNTSAAAYDPKRQPWHNRDWFAKCVQAADLLIVSTPALTRYGPEKSVVFRNRLPAFALVLRPGTSPARGVVGWTGHLNVHPRDLQATEGGVSRVDAPFRVVGNATGVADALKIPPARVELGAAWQDDIPSYWKTVAQNIGVGIAPLEQSQFNRSKSGLKCQEYLTLGIPFVASPLPEYQWLVRESGAGLIAGSRGQWSRMVNRLLNDEDAYQQHRQAGLEWARENTLEKHIDTWIHALDRAAGIRPRNSQSAGRTPRPSRVFTGVKTHLSKDSSSGISVIVATVIPRKTMLARAVDSVLKQTLPPAAIHVAYDPGDFGGALNRQRALEKVTTEYVAPLDDDDEYLPQHLELLAAEIERTGADLVYPWFEVMGGTDPFPWAEGKSWDNDEPHQVPVTWLARTETIKAVGGFAGEWDVTQAEDPGVDALGHRAGEDYRLILRLVQVGAKIVHLPVRTWLWHHHSANSMGLPSRVNWTERT